MVQACFDSGAVWLPWHASCEEIDIVVAVYTGSIKTLAHGLT
jgi:hypothetical protein